MEKGKFDQHLKWAEPKYRWKYTTVDFVLYTFNILMYKVRKQRYSNPKEWVASSYIIVSTKSISNLCCLTSNLLLSSNYSSSRHLYCDSSSARLTYQSVKTCLADETRSFETPTRWPLIVTCFSQFLFQQVLRWAERSTWHLVVEYLWDLDLHTFGYIFHLSQSCFILGKQFYRWHHW